MIYHNLFILKLTVVNICFRNLACTAVECFSNAVVVFCVGLEAAAPLSVGTIQFIWKRDINRQIGRYTQIDTYKDRHRKAEKQPE